MTLNRKRPYIVALFEGARLRLFKIERGTVVEFGELYIDEANSRHADTHAEALIRPITDAGWPIVLRLGEDAGLVTYDTLPSSARDSLKAVIGHRLDALTPWSADRAAFDAIVTGRDGTGRIDVMIAAAPKTAVDEAMEALGAFGLTAAAVDIVVSTPDEPNRFDLLRSDAPVVRRSPLRTLATVCLAALAVTAAYFTVSWWRGEQELAEQRNFALALQDRLSDLPALHEELDALKNQAGVIADRRREQPSVALAIEELSRTLPDGVWLSRIAIDGPTLAITGYAPDAEVLLGLLEQASAFGAAEFRAANRPEEVMVDGIPQPADAFTVAAEIALRGTELPLAGSDP